VTPPPAVLDIRNLSCRIAEREVLHDIKLTIEAGETVVLLGRSGCGKTTLLKCVNGLIPASRGEIVFQGRPAAEWDPFRMRRAIGYVIQDFGLFPHWTVAAKSSVSESPARWLPTRPCCCSTNHSARSIRSPASSCNDTFLSCAPTSTRPRYSSRTTSGKR